MGERPVFAVALCAAAAATTAVPVQAEIPVRVPIALRSGRLADALRELSVQAGTGILFEPSIGEKASPRISGRMSVEQALQQLLEGSNLTFRRTAAGTIVVAAIGSGTASLAIPEILVVGRKTQNADIRRSENDIRPYRVLSSTDIVSSHSDDVDELLRTRLTSNAELFGPSSDPANNAGSNRSETNLHGLGPNQTLVLVDGARMPGLSIAGAAFQTQQSDLNGLPLFAIDRIEALTGTAGGIYGPGAIGGVINVVLKRDYRGADLAVTYGLTDRGDAARKRIDARFGFTPDHGCTDMMLTISRSVTDGLAVRDRSYTERSRQLAFSQDPSGVFVTYPSTDGLYVQSLTGQNLRLTKSLGGASLGSSFSYFSAASALAGQSLAALQANAGQFPNALSPDGSGATRSLTNSARMNSLLLNIRHHFGSRVEAYADFVGYRNIGYATGALDLGSVSAISQSAPGEPFAGGVIVTFPLVGFDSQLRTADTTYRLSTGAIITLPRAWKADLSYNFGAATDKQQILEYQLNSNASQALVSGLKGAGGEPPLNPFGDWNTFLAALQAYKAPYNTYQENRDLFQDGMLRLAGPIASTKAGLIALSLLAERRREHVPDGSRTTLLNGITAGAPVRGFTQTITSVYGEARVPIVPKEAGPWPLRGLEFQLALRHDRNKDIVPTGATDWLEASQAATAYTIGFRSYPDRRLMVRASLSTGVLPPTPNLLLPASLTLPFSATGDPQRGGHIIGSERAYTLLYQGSPHLESERARTYSFGIVLNPDGRRAPRISVDFTHIDKSNEITTALSGNIGYFVANEGQYPGRITRAPLTAADRAAGFTGGVITAIDTSYLNIGHTAITAIDMQGDWSVTLGKAGTLRFYGSATWEPHFKSKIVPDVPAYSYAGFESGAVKWRGNLGIDWARGALGGGLNGQYYGGYDALDPTQDSNPDLPGTRIPPQFYLDLSMSYRLRLPTGPVRNLELRLGIENLLDHAPPIVTTNSLGYSYLGDPRRRRFEFTIAAHL